MQKSVGKLVKKEIKTTNEAVVQKEESAMAAVTCCGKILCTRELVYGKEILSLPKGHIEKQETALQAAVRECFEETNIRLDESNLVQRLTPYSYEFFNQSQVLVQKTLTPYLFEVEDFGNPQSKEERILSVQWMDIEEFLSQCSYENVRKIVREFWNTQK